MEDTEKSAASEQEKTSSQDTQNAIQEDACRTELLEIKNRYLYLNAEFDNYKKRISKEQASWAENAQDRILIDLLMVADDLDRAFSELRIQELPGEIASHFQGFSMIVKSVSSVLKKYDIEEIPHAKVFDPEFFEAVMQQESLNHLSGDIIAILQKGYKRRDRVLRPAKVVVAQ